MSYYACESGRAHIAPTVQPVETETEEALRNQLAALGRAAAAVLTALLTDGYSVPLAAEFAAVCDQTSTLALRVAERPVVIEQIDEHLRDTMRSSAGWDVDQT